MKSKTLSILSIALIAVIVCLAISRMNWQLIGQQISEANPTYLMLATLVCFFIVLTRSMQWQIYLNHHKRQEKIAKLFNFNALFFLLEQILPSKTSEILRPFFIEKIFKLKKREGLKIIVYDLFIGSLSLVVILSVCFFIKPEWFQIEIPVKVPFSIIILILTLTILVITIFILDKKLELISKIKKIVFLPKQKLLSVIIYFILIKFIEMNMLFLIQKSLDINLDFSKTIAIILMINLSFIIPNIIPSNFIIFETVGTLAYINFGVDKELGFLASSLFHLAQFFGMGLFGLIGMNYFGFKLSLFKKLLSKPSSERLDT